MGLPKSLWPEITKAVGYIKNRSPGSDGKTPFEKANNEKPDVLNLRVLGCRV